jgi:hypothetical protein
MRLNVRVIAWRTVRAGGCARAKIAVIGAVLSTFALLCAGCQNASSPSPNISPSAEACTPHVIDGALPSWAQAGFSDPESRANYELGRESSIAAILFKYPLLTPPSTSARNKILWVSHVPADGSPLLIEAQRMIGNRQIGAPVRRQVDGGPGPSIVNLPVAGCWRLSLRWSGHRDSLDVTYVTNGAA